MSRTIAPAFGPRFGRGAAKRFSPTVCRVATSGSCRLMVVLAHPARASRNDSERARADIAELELGESVVFAGHLSSSGPLRQCSSRRPFSARGGIGRLGSMALDHPAMTEH